MTDSPVSTNIRWHHGSVDRDARRAARGHGPAVLWLTGLSGSGKSTLARAVEARLHERGVFVYVLDGDNLRHGLCSDLGFAPEDRKENIRRVGEVARLFSDAGAVVLTAFISPYRDDRARARTLVGDDFVEVHVSADVSVCEERDPKGLYEKARAGEIANFTGISAPYEAPESPELVVNTGALSIDESAAAVIAHLEQRGVLPS
ncbi:MAG: adenylyl-sulfate kinase [Myxococcota bacterium]